MAVDGLMQPGRGVQCPSSKHLTQKCGYVQAELQLVAFHPRNLAQLLWAVATMQVVPNRAFCVNFLAESGDKMTGFKPIDIANTLWALATLNIQPPPDWLAAALSAAEQRWQHFKPQELAITLWGFAKLGQDLGVIRQQHSQQGFGTCRGLDEEGFRRMMMTVAWQFPGMTTQQCSIALWGLVVGGAGRDLGERQVQDLESRVLGPHHAGLGCDDAGQGFKTQRPPKKALWQILILILADFNCYSGLEVAVILWSLAWMLAARSHHTVQCHTLLKLLVVAAQWRIQTGVGVGDWQERSKMKAALRSMAREAQLGNLLLFLRGKQPVAAAVM
eukprot:gene8882-9061_t